MHNNGQPFSGHHSKPFFDYNHVGIVHYFDASSQLYNQLQ